MATPTTALANIRAVKSWMDKPFTDFNDSSTTIYSFECVCSQTAYDANKLAYGAKLSSAAAAGLIAINYTDTQARWVGDSNFSYSDGGYIRFIRQFARVPLAHDDYSSTVVTTAPVFGTTRSYTTINGNIYYYGYTKEYIRSPSQTVAKRSRLGYQYSTNPELLQVFTEGSFSVTVTDRFSTVIYDGSANVYESTKITRWMGDIYQAVTAFAY